ncbi:MAG: response regulator [Polyangiales bacterium]
MDHPRFDEPGGADGLEAVRVLLVGDEEPFLHRLGDLFESVGHGVSTAYDARGALLAVGDGRVDVLVCDLGATRLQAIATVLALRALGDDAPPVVMISSLPNLSQHCAALRVDHFVAQPFRFSRLLDLVERVAADHRATPAERSGVFLRAQVAGLLDAMPDLEALSFG